MDVHLEVLRVSQAHMKASQAAGDEFGAAAGSLLVALGRMAGLTISAAPTAVMQTALRDALVSAIDMQIASECGEVAGTVQ